MNKGFVVVLILKKIIVVPVYQMKSKVISQNSNIGAWLRIPWFPPPQLPTGLSEVLQAALPTEALVIGPGCGFNFRKFLQNSACCSNVLLTLTAPCGGAG